jgi:uncharacterized protein (DUF2147 family)
MKKLTILAALLATTTSAYAGNNSISFEIDGHKIRIEAPRNCDQLSCVKISGFDFNGFGTKHFGADDTAVKPDSPAPVQTPSPAARVQAASPQTPALPSTGNTAAAAAVASTSPLPAARDEVAPAAPSAASAPALPAPVAATPVEPAATPIGIWSTEDDKGRVRIESCGQNLCGFAVKTGEKILINMRQSDSKWVGQIHDPDSGRNYDSTIAMKGTNSLRVQGCAFG